MPACVCVLQIRTPSLIPGFTIYEHNNGRRPHLHWSQFSELKVVHSLAKAKYVDTVFKMFEKQTKHQVENDPLSSEKHPFDLFVFGLSVKTLSTFPTDYIP